MKRKSRVWPCSAQLVFVYFAKFLIWNNLKNILNDSVIYLSAVFVTFWYRQMGLLRKVQCFWNYMRFVKRYYIRLGYPERCHNHCFIFNCIRLHYFPWRSSSSHKNIEVVFHLKKFRSPSIWNNLGRLTFKYSVNIYLVLLK